MTSARFCTSCGGTVVDGACTSCRKKVAVVPGWDPEPNGPPEPAAPTAPTPAPIGPSAAAAPPTAAAPVGPAFLPAAAAVKPAPMSAAVNPAPTPAAVPAAPFTPPPPSPGPARIPTRRRARVGPVVAVVVLVLALGGGGLWWFNHRSPAGSAGPSAPRTSVAASSPARTTAVSGGRPTPQPFGVVRVDVPAGFVRMTAPGGGLAFGNRASRPTDYLQLTRSALPGGKKPAAYSAAELKALADRWQAAAIAAARSTSCPRPTLERRTVGAPGAAPTVDLFVTCTDAKGSAVSRVGERVLIAPDSLAYRLRVVGPPVSWTRAGAVLPAVLTSLRAA